MPHQNKSETEDTKRKKANELQCFDKLYSVSRCYELITGKMAEGNTQPLTGPVHSLVF